MSFTWLIRFFGRILDSDLLFVFQLGEAKQFTITTGSISLLADSGASI